MEEQGETTSPSWPETRQDIDYQDQDQDRDAGSKKEGGSKIKEGAPPSYVALATTLQNVKVFHWNHHVHFCIILLQTFKFVHAVSVTI